MREASAALELFPRARNTASQRADGWRILMPAEKSGIIAIRAPEPREIITGRSVRQWLILVCFAVRETGIRIISTRRATRLERKDYEENVRS